MSKPDITQLVGESAAIMAGLETGLLDLIAAGPVTIEAAAAQLGLDVHGVARVFDLYESLGVTEREAGGHRLAERHAEALARMPAAMMGMRYLWSNLGTYLREGQPLVVRPEAGARGPVYSTVVAALAKLFETGAESLAGQLSRSRGHVVDVGAGSGVWSLAMASRDSGMRVTAIDRPEVLPRFLERAQALGLSSRVDTIGADYHEIDLSTLEYDRVVLANVLHLEDEDAAAALIARSAAGLATDGDLITVDAFPRSELDERRSYDLYRLHLAMRTGGRIAHTEDRIRAWVREAGFEAGELLRVGATVPDIGALVATAA